MEISTAKLLSYDQDTICTQFIDGDKCSIPQLPLDVLSKFKSLPPLSSANFSSYIERIDSHLSTLPDIVNGGKLVRLLQSIEVPSSFNHGDFSADNMIESNGRLYLIDPIFSPNLFQSYMIDAAKHLFSILYYHADHEFYRLCRDLYIDEL